MIRIRGPGIGQRSRLQEGWTADGETETQCAACVVLGCKQNVGLRVLYMMARAKLMGKKTIQMETFLNPVDSEHSSTIYLYIHRSFSFDV